MLFPHMIKWSSRQGEFHPKPLTEPYLTVSRHTALPDFTDSFKVTCRIDCRANLYQHFIFDYLLVRCSLSNPLVT